MSARHDGGSVIGLLHSTSTLPLAVVAANAASYSSSSTDRDRLDGRAPRSTRQKLALPIGSTETYLRGMQYGTSTAKTRRRIGRLRLEGETSAKRRRVAAALETAEALHIDAPFSALQIRSFVERFVAGEFMSSADVAPTTVGHGTSSEFGVLVAAMAADGSIETEAWAMATVDDRVAPAAAPHCAMVRRWCGKPKLEPPAFITARVHTDRPVAAVSTVGTGI